MKNTCTYIILKRTNDGTKKTALHFANNAAPDSKLSLILSDPVTNLIRLNAANKIPQPARLDGNEIFAALKVLRNVTSIATKDEAETNCPTNSLLFEVGEDEAIRSFQSRWRADTKSKLISFWREFKSTNFGK